MILVNLVPPEFRGRASHRWNLRSAKGVPLGFAVLFLVLTAIFYFQYLVTLREVKAYRQEWLSLQNDVMRVEETRRQMDAGSRGERTFLEEHILPLFRITSLLSAVSDLLPETVWLVELRVGREQGTDSFVLKGASLPLRGQSSVSEIEKYLGNLKEKLPQNTELVLTTSRQQNEKGELTLFTAAFKWT